MSEITTETKKKIEFNMVELENLHKAQLRMKSEQVIRNRQGLTWENLLPPVEVLQKNRFFISGVKPQSNKEKIIALFFKEHTEKLSPSEIPKCLFNTFSNFLISGNFCYDPDKINRLNILAEKSGTILKVDCYDISKAFIELAIELGVEPKKTAEVVYKYRMSKKLKQSHPGVLGKFHCFDPENQVEHEKTNNTFFFAQHCVARLYNRFYDLTFLCHYTNQFDIFDQSPKSVIFSMAANNDLKKLCSLLKTHSSFDINEVDNEGRTLLHWATINDNLEMATMLLKNKCDANIKDNNKKIPLQLIIGLDSELFLLLEQYSDKKTISEIFDEHETSSKMCSIVSDIEHGNLKNVIAWLQPHRKFNINQQDSAGWTLLHWATYFNDLKIVKFLLGKNIGANKANNDGQYPLSFIEEPESELFYLLASKSDDKIVYETLESCALSSETRDLMHKAIEATRIGNVRHVARLIVKGLPINHQDSFGWTLLHWAAHYKRYNVARFLLSDIPLKGKLIRSDASINNKHGAIPLDFINDPEDELFKLIAQHTDKDIADKRIEHLKNISVTKHENSGGPIVYKYAGTKIASCPHVGNLRTAPHEKKSGVCKTKQFG